MGKWIFKVLLWLPLAVILLLQAMPQLFFGHCYQQQNITVYTHAPETEFTAEVLRATQQKLAVSELYDVSYQYHIFIGGSRWWYRALAADLSDDAFGRTTVFNNIIVRRCELSLGECFSDAPRFNRRPMAALLAHEITHVNIRQAVGVWREMLLPVWKKEGVADYVAANSSFTHPQAVNYLLDADQLGIKSFNYYEYRQLATYAIQHQNHSLRSYLLGAEDIEAQRVKMRSQLRSDRDGL